MSYIRRRAAGALMLSSLLYAPLGLADTLQITGPDGRVKVEQQALGQYGPTKRNDTLWRIANEVRPDTSLTVYQVMQALFEANPHAFTSDNFNSLERNKMLTIPTVEVISGYPKDEAKASAKQHDTSWQPITTGPQKSKLEAPKPAPEPVKVVESSDPKVTEQLTKLQGENQRLKADLDEQKESLLQLDNLRAELDANTEEMALMVEQNAKLQEQMQQLSKELAMLQAALDEQQSLNRQLEQQLDDERFNQANVAASTPVVNEPEEAPTFYQSFAEYLWVMIAGVIAFIAAIGAAIFFWLRSRKTSDNPIQDGEMIKPIQTGLDPLTEMVPEAPAATASGLADAPPPPPADAPSMVDDAIDDPLAAQADAENDVLSLDELLNDEELTSVDMEQVFDDSSAVQSAPEPITEPMPEAMTEADVDMSMPDPELAPADPTPDLELPDSVIGDDFIDIDKLLEESENTPSLETDNEADTIAPMQDTAADDGGFNAKLDLARAYIEIEDVDSAKSLLKEVEEEGNEAQKKEATLLLSQL